MPAYVYQTTSLLYFYFYSCVSDEWIIHDVQEKLKTFMTVIDIYNHIFILLISCLQPSAYFLSSFALYGNKHYKYHIWEKQETRKREISLLFGIFVSMSSWNFVLSWAEHEIVL